VKPATAEAALLQVLGLMETEDWDQLTTLLADDVELADELTATWLRGRERVAAYLQAQDNVVTDITNAASDISSRTFGDRVLVTFSLRQRYLLEGMTKRETFTGCAIFKTDGGQPLLSLFHLGEADAATNEMSEPEMPVTGPAPGQPIGIRIRERRSAAGLTLRALAAQSGLSPSFLSQVERSKADLTVSSLRQLARGLGTTVGDLLGEDGAQRTFRSRVDLRDVGMMLDVFLAEQPVKLDGRIIELHPGSEGVEQLVSPVERFVYVLDGTLAVSGSAPATLNAGDGAYLPAGRTHLRAQGNRSARFLSVHTRITEEP
jgi:transcriptional regulator with XRE-family HTH domain